MRRLAPLALALSFAVASASAAQSDGPPADAVRLDLPECAPGWLDRALLARALSVELALDGMRVDPAGALVLAIEVACDADADGTVVLAIGPERRTLPLVDVAPRARVLALALGARDFVAEMRTTAAPTPIAPPPTGIEEREHASVGDEAARLAIPAETSAQLRVPSPPEAPVPPAAPVALAIEVSARGTWLGLRIVAPSLSIEGQARFTRTPLALWVAADALYAQGSDPLGDVRAFDVGGRAGVRLVFDAAPLALALSVGAMAAYARAEGVPPGGGTRRSVGAGIHGGVMEGALVGIDAAVQGSLQLSENVALTLSIGALGYLVGFEARAEDRAIVSFRDVAPWAAVGLGFAP